MAIYSACAFFLYFLHFGCWLHTRCLLTVYENDQDEIEWKNRQKRIALRIFERVKRKRERETQSHARVAHIIHLKCNTLVMMSYRQLGMHNNNNASATCNLCIIIFCPHSLSLSLSTFLFVFMAYKRISFYRNCIKFRSLVRSYWEIDTQRKQCTCSNTIGTTMAVIVSHIRQHHIKIVCVYGCLARVEFGWKRKKKKKRIENVIA